MEETVKETKRVLELPLGTPLQIQTVGDWIRIEWEDVPPSLEAPQSSDELRDQADRDHTGAA